MTFEFMQIAMEQMKKCICKIKLDNKQGTGFFCKIPFPDQSKMLTVFITDNHIIDKNQLYKNSEKIKIDIKEELEIKEIELNNRMKYTNEEYDVTIIEIKEEDNIKNYLKLDDSIINDIENNINKNRDYINETIYIIQYPENKLSVSYGILNEIYEDKKYNFNHKCSTRGGSSGSPILNINNKLIGIHKEGNTNLRNNIGAFLNYPIKEFIKLNNINKNKKIENQKDSHVNNNSQIKSKNKGELIKGNNKLIENMKSKDIIKILFSHLDEKIKLKTIKYNKKLQNMIDINLINYKFFSGRYIEYETKYEGKEYNGFNNNLIFEGEYLNGERNGKGKEYYNDRKLFFEGEYSKGKRNGKGKEYDDNGKLIFEGEYLNGQRNAKGKEYNEYGKLLFEGEYEKGKKISGKMYDLKENIYIDLEKVKGLIEEYYPDTKILYECEYSNGERNGKGKEYNNGKLIFEGEYKNDKRNGIGKEYNYNGQIKFEGKYINDRKYQIM